jgi:hypothetical protein
MITGSQKQAAKNTREENAGQISNRRVWTAVLLSVVALVATLGTVGCGVTRQAGESPATPSSNNAKTVAAAATSPSGSTTQNQPAATSDGNVTSPTSATAAMLSASASTLSFGNVQVGTSTSQLITLTNSSNSNLTISAVSTSGAGFSTSGASDITLTANQSINMYVNFDPTAAGSAAGTVIVASNAMNSMVSVSISGTGVAAPQAAHTVGLSWTPSSSSVSGYFVERGNTSGGPYTQVNAAADTNSNYSDAGVTSGTYFYVVTAVDLSNVQSQYSNEVQVIVP